MSRTACRRCDFKGEEPPELAAHAVEAGHPLCVVKLAEDTKGNVKRCGKSLTLGEQQACGDCVNRARDSLEAISEVCARLPAIAENAGYLNQPIVGGTAMVILAGGNIDGGGPDDHIAFNDPLDPLAVLEHNERDWRLRFGHGRGDQLATVESCSGYLLTWLRTAARQHPDFDDFAFEVNTLARRLGHTAGMVNDPEKATAKCIDCGGTLVSPYRGGHETHSVPDGVTRPGLPWEGREMRGQPNEEPEPVWECQRCGMIYSPVEYRLAVRMQVEERSELAG